MNHPEIQEMIDAAQLYLQGREGLTHLHGYIGQAEHSPSIQKDALAKAWVNEWRKMLNSAWNEWGANQNLIDEKDFRRWIQSQIS